MSKVLTSKALTKKQYDACFWHGRHRGSRIHLQHPGITEEEGKKRGLYGHRLQDSRSYWSARTICEARAKHCRVTHKAVFVNCPRCLKRMKNEGESDPDSGPWSIGDQVAYRHDNEAIVFGSITSIRHGVAWIKTPINGKMLTDGPIPLAKLRTPEHFAGSTLAL